MLIATCLVGYYCSEDQERKVMLLKAKLIYWRLLDTILKLEYIPNHEEGDEYLDVKNLNSELRFAQKFDNFKTLWEGDDVAAARTKSTWLQVLEAVERDITSLNNDYKYKRLVKLVDQRYGNKKIDFNDLY